MKNLRDRLGRLDHPGTDRGPAEFSSKTQKEKQDENLVEDLRKRLDKVLGSGRLIAASKIGQSQVAPPKNSLPRRALDEYIAGRRESVGDSTVFVTEYILPTTQRHGRMKISDLSSLAEGACKHLFPECLEKISNPGSIVFLDTETTGLAGGAGTIAFMIGIGRWASGQNEGFKISQLFLEDLDREAPLLDFLAQELIDAECLVTYNGKCYDIPLLENRFVLNRREWPIAHVPHLDMLFSARTLWRAENMNCRLSTLEQSVLGFQRNGDIPGSEIPALYNWYLRQGANARLADVFTHNRYDIASLAGLLWAAGQATTKAGPARAGAGLIHAKKGRTEKAKIAFKASLNENLPIEIRKKILGKLALEYKKDRDWNRALGAWRQLLKIEPDNFFAIEESAKALEHGLSDFKTALTLVENAINQYVWCEKDRKALERRIGRLRRKTETDPVHNCKKSSQQ